MYRKSSIILTLLSAIGFIGFMVYVFIKSNAFIKIILAVIALIVNLIK